MSRGAGIVLAAGLSRRLGRPKQLLMLDGRPVVRHVVEQAMASSLGEVIVVLGARAEAVRDALSGLPVRFVLNERYAEGQGTSIAAGVASLGPDVEAAVILLGDQPEVAIEAINAVVLAGREGASIVMTAYDDGRGHPVLFGREHFRALTALSGDSGGREVIRHHSDQVVLVRMPGSVPADIDTEADWAALRERAGGMRIAPSSTRSPGSNQGWREGGQIMDTSKITEHMSIVGSDHTDVGTVDHLDEQDMVKITKDDSGKHHWIPVAWVARVDEHVHLDRPGAQAKEEWSDSPPKALESPQ